MQKNKAALVNFILLIMFMGSTLLPFSASALIIPTTPPTVMTQTTTNGIVTKHICPSTDIANPDEGLVTRIIPCIRDSIVFAINSVMATFTSLFNDVFKVAFTLVIIIFGISVLTGNTPSISQSGIMLAIKIAAVVMIVNRFPPFDTIYPMMLNSLEELLNIMARPATIAFAENGPWNRVTSAAGTSGGTATRASFTCAYGTFQASEVYIMDIWNIVDCYIELLIGGIFSQATLDAGILGFILAATFSTAMGFFVGMAGLYMIATALMIIARAVYIFLTSYLAFSFMVLISSIFIPLILFQSTKRFFDAWLRLTISFLLQPVFVFGYLIMFLVAFNVTVFSGRNSLYYAIAGTDSLVTDFHIGTWMTGEGIYKEQLKVKDSARNAPTADEINTTVMNQTQVQDKQGIRADDATYNAGTLSNLGNGAVINFFQTGIATNVIDWQRLAQQAWSAQWGVVDAMAAGPAKDEAAEKLYLDYKISVLLAFMMAAIVIYIFYSLIEYLPFIGTATMGEAGVMPFGVGDLAPPGNSILGGPR